MSSTLELWECCEIKFGVANLQEINIVKALMTTTDFKFWNFFPLKRESHEINYETMQKFKFPCENLSFVLMKWD